MRKARPLQLTYLEAQKRKLRKLRNLVRASQPESPKTWFDNGTSAHYSLGRIPSPHHEHRGEEVGEERHQTWQAKAVSWAHNYQRVPAIGKLHHWLHWMRSKTTGPVGIPHQDEHPERRAGSRGVPGLRAPLRWERALSLGILQQRRQQVFPTSSERGFSNQPWPA